MLSLSALIVLSAAGGVATLLVPFREARRTATLALAFACSAFVLSLLLFARFDLSAAGFQFVERQPWIDAGRLHAEYHLGIDGISLSLIVLTALLTPLVILASWNSAVRRPRTYFAFLLFLEAGTIGVFSALDLVLFYAFWEAVLLPMVFLIGIWGHDRRIYAAVKFFIYTAAGSLLMLGAILALYFYSGGSTFSLPALTAAIHERSLVLPARVEALLFLAFFFAFAIKVPLFPLHTWLPDAHVEAPTAGSVLLAGILLKMGTYGMLRFCLPLFPRSSINIAPLIVALAIVGIVYGALVAMVQPDLKKLIAYSSISHLGFAVLGIFAFNVPGVAGASFQMLAHGISTSALFLVAGMLYERRHTREISEFGGLAHTLPGLSAVFMITAMASIGLPGLNGFVGEWLVLQGTFLENPVRSALAALAMVLSAVYLLRLYQKLFWGPISEVNRGLKDLDLREYAVLVPLLALMLWMGLYPATFMRRIEPASARIVSDIDAVRQRINPVIYHVQAEP